MQEILIILVVALIVIGPKRLPDLARTLGKGFAEFRKAADDLQETVRMDLQKEKHEEFRKKYPHLVPEEEGEGDTRSEEDREKGPRAATGTAEGEPPPQDDPQPSYRPEEIEGGDKGEA